MTDHWQTWAALGVVFSTAAIMVYRVFFVRKPGCASGCGCDNVKSKAQRARASKPG